MRILNKLIKEWKGVPPAMFGHKLNTQGIHNWAKLAEFGKC